MVLHDPMNGLAFLAYVEQVLVLTLAADDTVITDNLLAYTVASVRTGIWAAAASLCLLPPYSPDLNAIEPTLAKLKVWLRRRPARTIPAFWNTIATALTISEVFPSSWTVWRPS